MKINISLSNADENNKNKIESGYLYSSNNKSDNNKTINEKDNLDDNLNNEDLEDNGEPLKDNEEFLKAYNDAMNSGNKDRVISILKKRLDHYELSITELQMIIQHLRNDIHKKEKLMNLLTKTNTSLKKSLNDFSKQLDDKILAMNEKQNPINVKKLKISKTPNKFTIKNDGDDKKSKNDEEKQYTEINNVLALNKIYQKDNENLKILLNSYGSVDKKKELENINKSLKEEYNNLNEEMIELKKKYLEHSYCEKKRNALLEKIKYLTEENKRFKNDIKNLNLKNKELSENILTLKSNTNNNAPLKDLNAKNANDKSNQMKSPLKSPRLPKLSKSKNSLEIDKPNKNQKNKDNNKDEEVEKLMDKDEIYLLIQLFKGDEKQYSDFKKKLIIYVKSKETIINKYNKVN